jgi:hypothetical protein
MLNMRDLLMIDHNNWTITPRYLLNQKMSKNPEYTRNNQLSYKILYSSRDKRIPTSSHINLDEHTFSRTGGNYN